MSSLDYDQLFHDPRSWPVCPNCQGGALVVGGHLASCVRCHFFGAASEIEQTLLWKYVRTKMCYTPHGNQNVLLFQRPGDLEEISCFHKKVVERSSQIAQRSITYPILNGFQVMMQKHGGIHPLAILSKYAGTKDYRQRVILNQSDLDLIQQESLRQTMVLMTYESDRLLNFVFEPDRKNPRGILVMEAHIYNSPPHLQAVEFDRFPTPHNFRLMSPDLTDQIVRNSLVWQPIAWQAVPLNIPEVFPVWVGISESGNQGNTTLSVSINQETQQVIARYCTREPWTATPVGSREEILAVSLDTAIERLAAEHNRMVRIGKESGTFRFQQDFYFKPGTSQTIILNELRNAQIWKHINPQ